MKTSWLSTSSTARAELARHEAVYADLKACASAYERNSEWLAQLISSWRAGHGILPDYLGLEPEAFGALMRHYFPGARISGLAASGLQVDFSRMLERDDLRSFLLKHAASPWTQEAIWLSDILVTGCMGGDHLWQDLGLWSRTDLSGLIAHNFPQLAVLNNRDMKWKKFFYKQLCETEGIYVCRAPSCEVCIDYPKCFEPEN